MTTNTEHRASDDRGSILPLALVITVVLSLLVVGLATYASATLRYGRVVENRADRLAAAEGGMRDVLERLAEDGSLCTTGAGTGTGIVIPVPQLFNDAPVDVRCSAVGATLSNMTSWAVVVTGEGGVPDQEGLWTQSGGGATKVFGGPTFVQRTELVRLQADLEIRDGNLWYTDPACAEGGEYVSDGASIGGPGGGDLTFDPTSRGVWCTNKTWDQLFFEPATAPIPAAAPPYVDFGPCRVFYPGAYTSQPAWSANNYMTSGDYYFNLGSTPGTAEISIDHAIVTAGRAGVAGDQQEIDNPACDTKRDEDVAEGATFYLDEATHFSVKVQGSLEILRRQQGVDYVSIHALGTHTLTYATPVVSTGSGANKQMALHGMVWAPQGSILFGEVTNAAAAQLLGGAVVAAIKADASASASGFVIQVQGSPQTDRYELTATSTKEGVTKVKVIAQLRFSAPTSGGGVGYWELAMNSWRVCESATC